MNMTTQQLPRLGGAPQNGGWAGRRTVQPCSMAPFAGEIYELSGEEQFVVDDASVWFVERGCVDLLSMPVTNGAPTGPRSHVLIVGQGRIFVGFGRGTSPSGQRMVAVGRQRARLIRASRGALESCLRRHQTGTATRALLRGWIADLHEGLTRKQGPSAASSVLVDEISDVADWAAIDWEGIRHLSRRVWTQQQSVPEQKHRDQKVRASETSAGTRSEVQHACAELVAAASIGNSFTAAPVLRVVTGTPSAPPDLSRSLSVCCQMVAEALGVTIALPPPSPGLDLPDLLRPSRLRARKVVLRDGWWRRDQGPILGSQASDGQAIALLRRNREYVAIRADGSITPVDAAMAATLAPFGHNLYRSLPATSLRIRDVVQFAARGCGGDLLILLLMSLLTTGLGMIPSVATGVLFNTIIPGAHRSQLMQMMVVLVVCAFSGTGLGLVRGFALMRLQQRMGNSLQAGVWDRLIRLPLTFSRSLAAGDLATRAMTIDRINSTLSGTALTTVLGGVFSLANLVMMFVYSPAMAARALLLIAIAVAVALVSGLLDLQPQRALMDLQAKTAGLVLQLLTSISKLRVAGAESRAFAQWAHLFAQQRRLQLRVRRIQNWFSAYSATFPILAQAFIFWAALPLMVGGPDGLRTGDFLAFSAAFASCFSSLLGMARAVIGLLQVFPLYQQAKPILQTCPEVPDGVPAPGRLSGAIGMRNVSFRYQDDGPLVLRDISLEIAPGEFVALVGPSGSGKSTILRLLLGFEKAAGGEIFYDQQEVGSIDIQGVRQQMGVVLQNGSLMPGDIHSNIAGAHPCTLNQAWEAAAMAGLADDIKAMPMQMHTVISEGATTLSGGQRQRLMIARAIVSRPKILLFDEATSALDNRTQAVVSASLEAMKATRVVVAHRLSTIVNADRIIVIDDGRIVQMGTYVQLLTEEGVFATLARRQLL